MRRAKRIRLELRRDAVRVLARTALDMPSGGIELTGKCDRTGTAPLVDTHAVECTSVASP